jgi:hypothetical protein
VESVHEIDAREVLARDESFFTALLAADHDLLGTISSGQLRFAEVTRYAEDRSVRLRDSAAVVAGRTRMVLRYQGDEVTAHSRYTPVYTRDSGRWRLMSAQGTPIRAPRVLYTRAVLVRQP